MKNTEVIQKNDFQSAMPNQLLLIVSKEGTGTKFGSNLKRIIFLTSMAGIGLFLNSCSTGYVATEPSYVEYSRPQRTSDLDIWIDGDWIFNSQTHAYVQRNGYWEKPVQGRTYISGSWQSTPKGKHWSKGHWQKKGGKDNRNSR